MWKKCVLVLFGSLFANCSFERKSNNDYCLGEKFLLVVKSEIYGTKRALFAIFTLNFVWFFKFHRLDLFIDWFEVHVVGWLYFRAMENAFRIYSLNQSLWVNIVVKYIIFFWHGAVISYVSRWRKITKVCW